MVVLAGRGGAICVLGATKFLHDIVFFIFLRLERCAILVPGLGVDRVGVEPNAISVCDRAWIVRDCLNGPVTPIDRPLLDGIVAEAGYREIKGVFLALLDRFGSTANGYACRLGDRLNPYATGKNVLFSRGR